MQPPRLLATLSTLDRYTLPRFEPDTLVSLLRSGRVTADRLSAQTDAIGPVGCAELLHVIMESVRPRRGMESLSGTDNVTRERVQVKVAEDMLGQSFVADVVLRGTAEDAVPFIRWGSRLTAIDAVRAVDVRAGSRYNPPLASDIVKQATDAILDRGEADPSLGGPSTNDLAREIRSRALFDEIADATNCAHASETPEGVARAARCEVALYEVLANPLCQPYGDGGRASAAGRQQRAKILEVTGSPNTISAVWAFSGQDPVESGAVLDALGRTAIISYARSNGGAAQLRHADCAKESLTVAEMVMRSLGYDREGVPSHHAEAVATLRDTAIGLRANSHASASNAWSRHLSPSTLLEYKNIAASLLKLTDRSTRERPARKTKSPVNADQALRESRRVTDGTSAHTAVIPDSPESNMMPLLDDVTEDEDVETGFSFNVGSPR